MQQMQIEVGTDAVARFGVCARMPCDLDPEADLGGAAERVMYRPLGTGAGFEITYEEKELSVIEMDADGYGGESENRRAGYRDDRRGGRRQ